MNPLSLGEIAAAVGSAAPLRPTLSIAAVGTDTRALPPGCLFVALIGGTHDGHAHLAAARAAGAAAAMVNRIPTDAPPDLPVIVVDDTRLALGRLAAHVRREFGGAVIAVGGSNGKTGTKGLIHAALGGALRGSASPKSFNNDIGVPLSIFAAPADDDYLVLELGTNHPGEIAALSAIARPDVAVITNVGAEHLEFFGDLDGVRAEEATILGGVDPASGLLVVNGDDAQLREAVSGFGGTTIFFGWGDQNDAVPGDVNCTGNGTSFQLHGTDFFVPQLGRHAALNATAAVLVARHLNVPDEQIVRSLSSAAGPPMRLQVQRGTNGITVLNDAYNANPHSMRAALETLRDLPTQGRRVAVLGDMRELGDTADAQHAEIGRFVADCKLDALVCVGAHAKQIAAAAPAGLEVTLFDTAADAGAVVRSKLRSGDLVLLKASRGVRLETVADAIAGVGGPSDHSG